MAKSGFNIGRQGKKPGPRVRARGVPTRDGPLGFGKPGRNPGQRVRPRPGPKAER